MLKKVQISLVYGLLLLSVQVNAQFIAGPGNVSCNSTVNYSFQTAFDQSGQRTSCSIIQWFIQFPDGRSESRSGQFISVNSGSASGAIFVSAFASLCSGNTNTQSASTVSVVRGSALRTPTSLSGPSFLCNSVTRSYTASAVSGATTYTFTVPSGWRINGVLRTSFTTTSRTVSITTPSAGSGNGQVRVRANPAAGTCAASSGQRTRTVVYGRQSPVITSGPNQINTNSFADFAANGIGISNFQWGIPSNWSALSGLNGPGIFVLTDNTVGNFVVEVTAESCGVTVGTFIDVTVSNGPGGFFGIQQEKEDQDVGLEDVFDPAESISIYPNPASGRVQLVISDAQVELEEISITNSANGQQVLRQKLNKDPSIDLSELKDGIYLLNMVTSEGQLVQKRVRVKH